MSQASGTFKPMKHRSGSMRDRLHGYTKRTLGAGGSINEAVSLPQGESCAGWVAVHAIDFYNDTSTIWAVMADDPYLSTFKDGEGYPSGVEYRWSDNDSSEAVSVPAPVYITKVLQWIADQINDECKFPDDDADEEEALVVFQTPQFAALCGQIFRRLFRIYGILYSNFFGTLEALGMAPHLNTCFKHFMYFCIEFGLLPDREIEPLDVLVKPIKRLYHASKHNNK
mmetsp:Transcript_45328/g.53074  ORF Transcript_45328/g.53074 Transcript_45328/m.53074 type:complete len:226 (-) Transcript_45328:400-1077(-)|eukprot:CAMPEP_0171305566 /NCGR_PEP_ID=MMETSP0816-20121228/15451_1 /TAXON_ID=420281 /ORGANISM="Proboscia inermis, Strain CCAP1064/1" /LENGTH=225 /DNA_ID=CAMNT_0011786517 /DNA_START=162 /DNA_END=842 /DNA_ORIENTATION=-